MDFRTFRHEILIAKHVCACRHGILAPVVANYTHLGISEGTYVLFSCGA